MALFIFYLFRPKVCTGEGNEYTITVLKKVQKRKCVTYGIFLKFFLILSFSCITVSPSVNCVRSEQAFLSLFNNLRSLF